MKINIGEKKNCFFCPVALAIKDAFPKLRSVLVTNEEATLIEWSKVTCNYRHRALPLPPEVDLFIKNFDLGVLVKPFEFELEA